MIFRDPRGRNLAKRLVSLKVQEIFVMCAQKISYESIGERILTKSSAIAERPRDASCC